MKAAVFYGKHDLRVEEISMPTPKADEVVIKVMACGICGTDIHIFEGDEGAAATPRARCSDMILADKELRRKGKFIIIPSQN